MMEMEAEEKKRWQWRWKSRGGHDCGGGREGGSEGVAV